MQIRVAVGVLVALVLVLLGPSVAEGLILSRCEMKQTLNQTFPGNTSANVTSEAAQIVCYAQLVSGLNTSKVYQPIRTAGNSTKVKPTNGQHHNPNSSEHSGEARSHKPTPTYQPRTRTTPTKPQKQRSTVNQTSQRDHKAGSKPDKGRKARSLKSEPESSNPHKPNDHQASSNKPTDQPHPPHTEPQRVKPTGSQTGHHDHDAGSKPEKRRESRSLNSEPKPGKSNKGVKTPKPTEHSKPNGSGIKTTVTRKPIPHTEAQKPDEATLYGIFQLPDWVACASGNKTTLNLCGLTCDKLIDDDITDDIACLRTLGNKPFGRFPLKQCASVVDAQFFSAC